MFLIDEEELNYSCALPHQLKQRIQNRCNQTKNHEVTLKPKKKQRQTKEIGKHNHSMLWSCLVQTFIADFLFFGFSFAMSPSEDPCLSTSIPRVPFWSGSLCVL